jgi:hypothetical protein
LPGQLIIKEFPTGRATMSTIESHISKVDIVALPVGNSLIINSPGNWGIISSIFSLF